MTIFISLLKKEALHVVRDTRTMVITILMPLLLLLLFGFAISTEVNNVRVVLIPDRLTDKTREIIQRFETNEYFDVIGLAGAEQVEEMLRSGQTDAAVFLVNEHGSIRFQIVVDASNTTVARASTSYIQNIIAGSKNISPVLTQTLYNPQLKSSYNFVPGILGMIFILVCAIMTSVSIVNEKENGTMNLLLVSPVKPRTIIFGKLIPYFTLSCIVLAIMLIISYSILGIPYSGNIFSVLLLSIIYIILSLSIGLLVSTIAKTQLSALIVSAVGFMIPVVMLSGMIFPIDNMPVFLQGISCIIPARWYTEAMRKIMIQQLDITAVWKEFIILTIMTLILMVAAVKKFNFRH